MIDSGEKVSTVLCILDIPRSTYYDSFHQENRTKRKGQAPPGFSLNFSGEKVSDEVIVDYLREYRRDPFLKVEGGAKVLSKYLRRDYRLIVNHKKLARLCREHGLALKKRGKKKSKFGQMAKNHQVTRPNQVWEFDIKYGYLNGEKKFFFFLAFIDVFTREIKGWHLGYSCQASQLASTLKLAIESEEGLEEDGLVIRSDNGPQMRAKLFGEHLKELPAEHEFIPVATPNKNAHIESFFSIYDRHLQEQYFWTLREAYQWTMEFVDFYNSDRIHGSLGMSPAEFNLKIELHGEEKFVQAI